MKNRTVPMCALAGCLALSGCARPRPTLHLYNWADYVKPELLARFEKQFGCRVVLDTFDSNEAMYAKLKAGATGYDLIFPSSYMVKIMDGEGMLQPLNHALLPNLAHVDRDYLNLMVDRDMAHSAPYMITCTGIAYRKDKIDDFAPTWSMFSRADLKGRMTMLNDMRETLGAALKLLGFSLNSTNEQELAAARDVVIGWKRNLAKFENEQYKTGIASEEFLVVHGYSGDILQVAEEDANIVFVLPREGFSLASDDMCIPKNAPNPALAHAFINFVHDPEVAAENMEFVSYLCPNKPAYERVPKELRDNPAVFLPDELRQKSEVIDDVGPGIALYTKMWDAVKAAE